MEGSAKELFTEIGTAIKAARKEKKMTMQDLSQEVNLSQSAISMIENGIRQPSIQALAKISHALGVDFTKMLIDETKQMETPVSQQMENPLQIKTIDFSANLNLTNFQCEYNDPEISAAIFQTLQNYLSEKLIDPTVLNELNHLMKQTIQQILEKKQNELKKLYNRLQED